MCLAVPMRIQEIRDDGMGIGDLDGSKHEIDLSLVESPRVGEYVIIHAGYAIGKVDEAEAAERLSLFKELAEVWQNQTP
jgi:hydrogenase expression/formation protein HypC